MHLATPSGSTQAPAATSSPANLSGANGGHGAGGRTSDRRRSHGRRIAHHLTFCGVLRCSAATVLAAIRQLGFGWRAPSGVARLPVALGTLGGIGLLIGPSLLYHARRTGERNGGMKKRC